MRTSIMQGKPLHAKYNPDDCIGDWGWIWIGEEDNEYGEWLLAVTFEDDDETLRISGWSMRAMYTDTSPAYPAEDWRGRPYIPLSEPAAEPGDALSVRMDFDGGASFTHVWREHGEKTEAARMAIMAEMLRKR